MMRKALLLLLAAALCGSLPARNTEETARLLAQFNSHPKADIAVELIKKYEGMHDRSDYPYYGYGHRRLPNENLSYDMTETEAEALLRKDLAVRYKLFRRFGKDALLLTVLSFNVGQGVSMWVKGYCSVTADTRKAGSSASWKPGTGTFTRNTYPSAAGKASPSAR